MAKSYTERLKEKTKAVEAKAVLDLRAVVHIEQQQKQITLKQSFDIIKACTIKGQLHLKQLAIALDRSKRIAICTGRRFGKTEALVIKAIDAAITRPNSVIYYCGKTLGWCKRVPWPSLQLQLTKAGIEVKLDYDPLSCKFPNGPCH